MVFFSRNKLAFTWRESKECFQLKESVKGYELMKMVHDGHSRFAIDLSLDILSLFKSVGKTVCFTGHPTTIAALTLSNVIVTLT